MDNWSGLNNDPSSLHKYAYANLDPINNSDPTGNTTLAELDAATSIRGVMTEFQTQIGFNILDAAMDPKNAGQSAGSDTLLGIATLGGAAAFKMFRMLSNRFRKTCNSFDGDTLVATETGLVPIKDIKIGDKVWAYNEETGEKSLQEVVHLITGEGVKDLVDITLASGEMITATQGHPFYLPETKQWMDAGKLTPEQRLLDIYSSQIKISGFQDYTSIKKVYNLTVASDHTYYVGTSQVLAHNASKCIPPLSIRTGHIIYGENAKGKAGGFHSILALQLPGRKFISRSSPNIYGVYKAKVAIKNPVSGKWKIKDSDMFPDAWSEGRILIEIKGAYMDALSKSFSGTGKWKGKSPSGVSIEGYIDDFGQIGTAYPIY